MKKAWLIQWCQQPTTCSKICFIDSFKLALHVSGDSFVHLQEHFDYIHSFLEKCTDCYLLQQTAEFQKAVYIVKVLLNMGETVARNTYSKLKRINKANFATSCWFLISLRKGLIFFYLGNNRWYKILLWKLLCTCASFMLAIYVAKTAQELHGLFV